MAHRSPSLGCPREFVPTASLLLALCLLAACAPAEVGRPPAGYGSGGGYSSGGGYAPPAPPPPPPETLERRPISQAVLRSSPAFLDFGVLELGDAVDRQLSLMNGGDEAAEVQMVAIEGLGLSEIPVKIRYKAR